MKSARDHLFRHGQKMRRQQIGMSSYISLIQISKSANQQSTLLLYNALDPSLVRSVRGLFLLVLPGVGFSRPPKKFTENETEKTPK